MATFCRVCPNQGSELCPLPPIENRLLEYAKLTGFVLLSGLACIGEATTAQRGKLRGHLPLSAQVDHMREKRHEVNACADFHVVLVNAGVDVDIAPRV